jgi:hypothetical protein
MNEFAGSLMILLAAIIGLGVLALYVFSIMWAFNDAEDRGKSGCLVAILVAFLSWPIGLVAWFIFRPDRHRH